VFLGLEKTKLGQKMKKILFYKRILINEDKGFFQKGEFTIVKFITNEDCLLVCMDIPLMKVQITKKGAALLLKF
jgi:hypothetical protein